MGLIFLGVAVLILAHSEWLAGALCGTVGLAALSPRMERSQMPLTTRYSSMIWAAVISPASYLRYVASAIARS